MGASTPHFALQLRNRIRTLIRDLPAGPSRARRGRARDRAPRAARFTGEMRGEPAQDGHAPLPSLERPTERPQLTCAAPTTGADRVAAASPAGPAVRRPLGTARGRRRAPPAGIPGAACPGRGRSARTPRRCATAARLHARAGVRRGVRPQASGGRRCGSSCATARARCRARCGARTGTRSGSTRSADGAAVVVAGGCDYYPGSRTSSPSFSFAVTDAARGRRGRPARPARAPARGCSTPRACSSRRSGCRGRRCRARSASSRGERRQGARRRAGRAAPARLGRPAGVGVRARAGPPRRARGHARAAGPRGAARRSR